MATLALEIDDLVVRYGDRFVVDHLCLAAHLGELTAVLGPNGAGKTTTIECAEGLRPFDSGTISVLGHPPGSTAARKRVGVMLQDGGLPMARTAGDVLALAATMHQSPRSPGDLAERLDLAAIAKTPVRRLSGGQRQRLALAVALMGQPDLLFLDEPSAGLDPHARLEVWALVRELTSSGVSVVLTTHLIDEVDALADHVHILDRGQVLESGSPEALIARFAGSDRQHIVLERELSPLEFADLQQALAPAVVEVDGPRLLVRGAASPALTATIATWCARHLIQVHSLHVGNGTLEHAYLSITGSTR